MFRRYLLVCLAILVFQETQGLTVADAVKFLGKLCMIFQANPGKSEEFVECALKRLPNLKLDSIKICLSSPSASEIAKAFESACTNSMTEIFTCLAGNIDAIMASIKDVDGSEAMDALTKCQSELHLDDPTRRRRNA